MVFGERRHMSDQPPVEKQNRSMATYAWLAALSALAAFAAVYVTLGTPDNQTLPGPTRRNAGANR